MGKKYLILVFVIIFPITYQVSDSTSADSYSLTVGNNISTPNSTLPSGTILHIPNAIQDIYAFPPNGYAFVNWTGDLAGVTDPTSYKIKVTMDRNRTITANFIPTKHIVITTRGYIHASPLLLRYQPRWLSGDHCGRYGRLCILF